MRESLPTIFETASAEGGYWFPNTHLLSQDSLEFSRQKDTVLDARPRHHQEKIIIATQHSHGMLPSCSIPAFFFLFQGKSLFVPTSFPYLLVRTISQHTPKKRERYNNKPHVPTIQPQHRYFPRLSDPPSLGLKYAAELQVFSQLGVRVPCLRAQQVCPVALGASSHGPAQLPASLDLCSHVRCSKRTHDELVLENHPVLTLFPSVHSVPNATSQGQTSAGHLTPAAWAPPVCPVPGDSPHSITGEPGSPYHTHSEVDQPHP